MKNGLIKELLPKYFAGECDPVEKENIERWINQSKKNKKELFDQKKIWESLTARQIDWDIDSSWKKFAKEHNITKEIENRRISDFQVFNLPAQKYSMVRYLKYAVKAAAVLLIMLGGYFALQQFGILTDSNKIEIAWVEKSTLPGEKVSITLSNNSKITLNADSKLRYQNNSTGKIREVYLEGEAYFEIEHDTSKSFVVHTNNITTTDMGTKFNICAFPDDKNISVSLVEGKVNVSKDIKGTKEGLVELNPDQQLVYSKEKEIGTVKEFEFQKEVGWKDNNLVFDGEILSNVFVKLERAYGVKFELADKSYSNRKIKINFRNASLWTITESLKKLTGLKYKTIKENNETKKVIFYNK